MQGGHHPDLGVDYYEDLFSSIKSRYRIHLHALSPSEIVHAARRSKLTVPETLARLRDAGLDSIPGGGAEILVDRVRHIIAPKKNAKRRVAVLWKTEGPHVMPFRDGPRRIPNQDGVRTRRFSSR